MGVRGASPGWPRLNAGGGRPGQLSHQGGVDGFAGIFRPGVLACPFPVGGVRPGVPPAMAPMSGRAGSGHRTSGSSYFFAGWRAARTAIPDSPRGCRCPPGGRGPGKGNGSLPRSSRQPVRTKARTGCCRATRSRNPRPPANRPDLPNLSRARAGMIARLFATRGRGNLGKCTRCPIPGCVDRVPDLANGAFGAILVASPPEPANIIKFGCGGRPPAEFVRTGGDDPVRAHHPGRKLRMMFFFRTFRAWCLTLTPA